MRKVKNRKEKSNWVSGLRRKAGKCTGKRLEKDREKDNQAIMQGNHCIKFYQERFADMTSLVVMLVSFSLLVWFGDYIGNYVRWNLIIVFLLIQSEYIGFRTYTGK